MNTKDRRKAVRAYLEASAEPVSATTLAEQFGVSRQVIVGDIALLRAGGADIMATPRGYAMQQNRKSGFVRAVACSHNASDMEEELCAIVDQGAVVLDVIVEHPVYGLLTGQLQLFSRHDISEFLHRVREEGATPLSQLTGGIHLHTLRCPDESTFRRVRSSLRKKGFLLEG
ncbi:MAG: transcription repressor NadR [Oscillospiraceae bacterium]|mgnify:CR=1 FL=1|nr:transcription repressor NadR [Oscillospiraceae bacterium]